MINSEIHIYIYLDKQCITENKMSELLSFYGKCCGPVWRAYTIVRVEAFHR